MTTNPQRLKIRKEEGPKKLIQVFVEKRSSIYRSEVEEEILYANSNFDCQVVIRRFWRILYSL
jgi:hypothetical protein